MKVKLGLALTALAIVVPVGASSATADGGPAAHAANAVPNVRCVQLDVAESRIRGAGFRVREAGGGVFGIVVRSNWVVVGQSPGGGRNVAPGSTITLYAGRSC